MKTINLASESATREEIFLLAEDQDLLVRTARGKLFIVAEVVEQGSDNEFADEIALTRKNAALRQLLAERSRDPRVFTIDEAREKLGLP
ncbi:MAG TPA: hypothetical protein VMV69_09745 [Pirellulales bacterium]|nr:hypothetical protein [Pirellulales bacterium]